MSTDERDDLPKHPFLEDVAFAYRFPMILMPIALAVLSAWGYYVQFRDADGEHFIGNFPIMSAAVMAFWWAVLWLLQRRYAMFSLLVRVITSSLLVFIPLLVMNALSLFVLWCIPANRAAIVASQAANHDFHYFWSEPLGMQILLGLLAGYGIAGFVGLATQLIVVLPVVSWTQPDVVTAGSTMEFIPDGRRRASTASFLFTGLGLLTLGLIFKIMLARSVDLDFVKHWIARRQYYGWNTVVPWEGYDREILCWIVGVALIVVGVVLLIWACVRTVRGSSGNRTV